MFNVLSIYIADCSDDSKVMKQKAIIEMETDDLEKPKISIIIPTLNEEKYLDGILCSLQNQTLKSFEVIISDDSSTDKTVEMAKKYGAKVVSNDRIGEYHSRNVGAKHARADILLFTSADALFSERVLEKTVKTFSEDSELIALYKPLIPFDGPLWSKIEYVLYYTIAALASKITHESNASSTFMSVKKTSFDKTSGFNDLMSADSILSRELNKLGKVKICFDEFIPISGRRIKKLGFKGFNKHFQHLLIQNFLPFLRKFRFYQNLLETSHQRHDKSRQLEN
jgi:glycosyltransferase involved in cell wall biosynthesis